MSDDSTADDLTPEGEADPEHTDSEPDIEPDTTADAEQDSAEVGGTDDEPDTFPRSYVEQLRAESQRYRERGKRADELARRLHTELVRATGRLADPTDLPFDAAHLDDAETLSAAIDDLLTRKPHMATRRPFGNIGQGPMSVASANFDLAAILRQRAQ